jgi:hypothetical protein
VATARPRDEDDAQQLAGDIERLIADTRDAGVSDEALIDLFADAAEALREGLS